MCVVVVGEGGEYEQVVVVLGMVGVGEGPYLRSMSSESCCISVNSGTRCSSLMWWEGWAPILCMCVCFFFFYCFVACLCLLVLEVFLVGWLVVGGEMKEEA